MCWGVMGKGKGGVGKCYGRCGGCGKSIGGDVGNCVGVWGR